MARNLTADEVREEHLASMGQHLGPVYHALWNEVTWLHAKWHEYEELYGAKPARLDLLNRAAGLFFRIVQDALWEDTLLHLARLTDPPWSSGKENLTILRLSALVDDGALREQLDALLTEAQLKTEFARDWRNRRIAHRDLAKALGEGAKPLASASRNHVDDALRALAAVLNRVNSFYLKSELVFDVITPMTGSVALLYVLRDGLAAEERRLARFRAGRPDPDDLGPEAAV
jgi:hypothetical protein